MRFCDIVGQENVKRQLCQQVQEGRIAHAQLFTGISGVGKLALALAYAQYVACPNKTANDSCGKCPSCLQYQKLQHPDLHFAFPIVKGDHPSRKLHPDVFVPCRDPLISGYCHYRILHWFLAYWHILLNFS